MKTTSKYHKKMRKKKSSQKVVFWKAPTKVRKKIINLNNSVPKRVIQPRSNSKMRFFTPVKMQPVPFLVKESIEQKRKLNPWGDADLDGTPNQFDCNPRDPSKDKILGRIIGAVTGGRYGQTAEEYAEEKALMKIKKIKAKDIGKRERERRIKEVKGELELGKQARQIRAIEEGPSGELRLLQEKLRSGKKLGAKERRKFASLLRRTKKEREKKIKTAVGGALGALTPLGEVREIRKLKAKAMKGGEAQGRGRPKGPSGEYSVEGRPVYEAVFQKVRSAENEKRKALGMEEIPTSAKSIPFLVKQQVTSQPAPQVVQEARRELAQKEEIPKEYAPPQQEEMQEMPEEEEYTYQEGEPVQEELYEQPQQTMTLQQAQMIEQREDNILRAPNIMKGEMLSHGTGIMSTPPEQNILNAPNVLQGQMRRVGQTEAAPAVTLSERPNPNPYGNVYTEIDPGSGRVIVKRRPQEKWATGEAI